LNRPFTPHWSIGKKWRKTTGSKPGSENGGNKQEELASFDSHCKQYFVPFRAIPSHGGRLWEYYHFLVDFAPAMYYHMHADNSSCKVLKLPDWRKDRKYELTLTGHPERSMQSAFDFFLGKPLNLSLQLVQQRELFPDLADHCQNLDNYIYWDCSPGEMEWAQQPSEYFTTFRKYAQSIPGIKPVKQDILAVNRTRLPGYSGPTTGAQRRHLDDIFYMKLIEDMASHGWKTSVLSLEFMSIRKQIELFFGATVVIGQHGAALSNMLFAHQDATIIEIGTRDYLCYQTLARKLGLSYMHFNSTSYPEHLGDQLAAPKHLSAQKSRVEQVLHTMSNVLRAQEDGSKTTCPALSNACFGRRFLRRANVEQAHKYDQLEFEEAVNQSKHSGNCSRDVAETNLKNLCMGGRIAPSVFLIGVQKAATTTFAARLAASPSLKLGQKKELHFFDSEQTYNDMGGVPGYLSHFPKCAADRRLVGFEASPTYFSSKFAPMAIRNMYGQTANQLKFVIIIRDPLRRIQSEFYHAKSLCQNATDVVWDMHVCNTNFSSYLEIGVDAQSNSGSFYLSNYKAHFPRWFRVFASSQFIIVPMKYVTLPFQRKTEYVVTERFHEYMWRILHVEGVAKTAHHLNKHTHPSLHEDVEPHVLAKANKFLSYRSGSKRLATLFLNHNATLWGCSSCNLSSAIRWLELNW